METGGSGAGEKEVMLTKLAEIESVFLPGSARLKACSHLPLSCHGATGAGRPQLAAERPRSFQTN